MSSDPLVIEASHRLILLGGHQEDDHHNVAGITTMPPSDDGPSPSSAPLVAKDDNTTMPSDRLAIEAAAHRLIFLRHHQEDHKNVAGITTMIPPSDDGPSPSSAPLVAKKDDNNVSSSTLVPHAAAANKVKHHSIKKQPPSSVPLAVVANKEDSEEDRTTKTNQSLLTTPPTTPLTLPKLLERSANAKKRLPLASTNVGHSPTPPAAAAPPGNSVVLRTTNELALRYGYCLGLKLRHCDQENQDVLVAAEASISRIWKEDENQRNVKLGKLRDKIQAYILVNGGPCHEPSAESAIAFGFGTGGTNTPIQLSLRFGNVLSLNPRYWRHYADPQQGSATVADATVEHMLAEAYHKLKTMSQDQRNQLWRDIEVYVELLKWARP
jgi:hypothetical protein